MIGQSEPQNPREHCEYNLSLLARRLRSIDLSKLAQGERVSECRALLQQIADVARSSEGLAPLTVPELSLGALADQFEVIGRDFLSTVSDESLLTTVSEQLKQLRLDV